MRDRFGSAPLSPESRSTYLEKGAWSSSGFLLGGDQQPGSATTMHFTLCNFTLCITRTYTGQLEKEEQ